MNLKNWLKAEIRIKMRPELWRAADEFIDTRLNALISRPLLADGVIPASSGRVISPGADDELQGHPYPPQWAEMVEIVNRARSAGPHWDFGSGRRSAPMVLQDGDGIRRVHYIFPPVTYRHPQLKPDFSPGPFRRGGCMRCPQFMRTCSESGHCHIDDEYHRTMDSCPFPTPDRPPAPASVEVSYLAWNDGTNWGPYHYLKIMCPGITTMRVQIINLDGIFSLVEWWFHNYPSGVSGSPVRGATWYLTACRLADGFVADHARMLARRREEDPDVQFPVPVHPGPKGGFLCLL